MLGHHTASILQLQNPPVHHGMDSCSLLKKPLLEIRIESCHFPLTRPYMEAKKQMAET